MYVTSILPSAASPVLVVNEYVPFEVKFEERGIEQNYLRYVADYSLLEIGVSPRNGMLSSVKLVQVSAVSSAVFPKTPLLVEEGLPIFDKDLWHGKKLLDIDAPIEILARSNSFLVLIDNIRIVDKCSQNNFFSVGISDGYLCWLRIDNISDANMAFIEKAIPQFGSATHM